MPLDWNLIGILTVAVLDCGPQPGRISTTIMWSVIAVKPSVRRAGRVSLQLDF
jgi:hypothetical protein